MKNKKINSKNSQTFKDEIAAITQWHDRGNATDKKLILEALSQMLYDLAPYVTSANDSNDFKILS